MGAIQSSEMEGEWAGVIVGQLSPRIGEFASGVLTEQIEPVIQKTLSTSPNETRRTDQSQEEQEEEEMRAASSSGKTFCFERTNLGNIPPKISNIKAHSQKEEDKITVDFDFHYLGNCDLQVKILGIRSGVRDIQVHGRARIVMTPTMGKLPFVGGVQLCFLDDPSIDFDMDGLANICDWPGLRRKVRREILEDTAKRCVYPNRLAIAMSGKSDPERVKGFHPTGFLFVRVLRAVDLPRKGGMRSLIGQDKPDTYCKVEVGAKRFVTSVIKNDTDPDWGQDAEWFSFPLETFKGHYLHVRLYDEDSLSRDEFLGRSSVFVQDIMDHGGNEMSTALVGDSSEKSKYDEVSGEVVIEARWFPLYDTTEGLSGDVSALGPSGMVALLSVFVYSCNNVMEMDEAGGLEDTLPTTRLTISHGSEKHYSEWEKKDPHPRYEFGANFRLTSADLETGSVQIMAEDKEGIRIGELSLPVSELVSRQWKRKLVQISPEEKPFVTMTLSANVKYLSA